ncbi:signal peptide-containing protein [Theileria equi strain WA]|uniref:Signal peptide-containing protein n=1 Tax=Theileria equi strain WA TaxID=1537102 RepID=L0AXG9_THEEQ|nr:signal peptide-containing protein [Theileria equi strain WA]AFZ79721.1 signal peptide-containing protein [Theileria equi strain WA]|eukprot:XP_004829387.1 signal peptide-containing protein [Theileria equi strain WA]
MKLLVSLGLLAAAGTAIVCVPALFRYFKGNKRRKSSKKESIQTPVTPEQFARAYATFMEELLSDEEFRRKLELSMKTDHQIPDYPSMDTRMRTKDNSQRSRDPGARPREPNYIYSSSGYMDQDGNIRFDKTKRSLEVPIPESLEHEREEEYAPRGEYSKDGNRNLDELVTEEVRRHEDERSNRGNTTECESDFEEVSSVCTTLRGIGDEFGRH